MSFVTPLIGLLCTLVGLTAPVYMAVLVWFIRWDKGQTYASPEGPTVFDSSCTVRGDLPWIFGWAQTIDMRFPGGLYEPTMRNALGNGGYFRRLWASYIWAGHRNRAHGLTAYFGHETTDYIPDPFSTDRDRSAWVRGGNVWTFKRGADWQRWRKIGSVFLITGFQVYKLLDGRFMALPVCTLKKA